MNFDEIKGNIEEKIIIADARSWRERALVFVTLLVLTFAFWEEQMMKPLEQAKYKKEVELGVYTKQIEEQNSTARKIIQEATNDPNAELREQHESLRSQVQELGAGFSGFTTDLISPKGMVEALRDIFSRQKGLTLVSFGSVPTKALLSKETGEAAGRQLFVHGLKIVFTGDFISTFQYLQAVEALNWSLFWDSLDYKVLEYPTAQVEIRLHTFSTEKDWIGV